MPANVSSINLALHLKQQVRFSVPGMRYRHVSKAEIRRERKAVEIGKKKLQWKVEAGHYRSPLRARKDTLVRSRLWVKEDGVGGGTGFKAKRNNTEIKSFSASAIRAMLRGSKCRARDLLFLNQFDGCVEIFRFIFAVATEPSGPIALPRSQPSKVIPYVPQESAAAAVGRAVGLVVLASIATLVLATPAPPFTCLCSAPGEET